MSERLSYEGLAEIVDNHVDAILLFARQWSAELAEDVVQEAFLQLVRRVKANDPPDNVVAWLYRVIRNELITGHHARCRSQAREQHVASERPEWFEPSVDTQLDAIRAAEQLQTLPIDERETVVARIWGGLSFEEIAELTKNVAFDGPSQIPIGHRCTSQGPGVNGRCNAMNRENENLSETDPEISAAEAALAQLRPRRQTRFADEVKSRMKDALSDKTPPSEDVTAMVRIPLTHYIRIAQFNAAAGGLLAGLFLGMLLGGSGVFFALSRFEAAPSQPVPASYTGSSQYLYVLLKNDGPLTPEERALFDQLDKELGYGRQQAQFRIGREPSAADRS